MGSPTNCGRLAHYLSKGKIKKVRLVLLDASPSRKLALEWARKLNIVVIDQ